ncbi:hypothetical protein G6F31_019389 [Rhizopus arrhizus]|nr:hypothetical protein G6F31_019389 [Rhizopus arrhizus]
MASCVSPKLEQTRVRRKLAADGGALGIAAKRQEQAHRQHEATQHERDQGERHGPDQHDIAQTDGALRGKRLFAIERHQIEAEDDQKKPRRPSRRDSRVQPGFKLFEVVLATSTKSRRGPRKA